MTGTKAGVISHLSSFSQLMALKKGSPLMFDEPQPNLVFGSRINSYNTW